MGWSDSQYSNPDYDRLYVRQAQAVDPADPGDITQRKAVTDEMQKILYRDDPYVVLWYNVNLQAFRTDGWTGYAFGAGRRRSAPFWNQLAHHLHRPAPPAASAPARPRRPGPGCGRRWSPLVAAGAAGFALLRRPAEDGGGRVNDARGTTRREDGAHDRARSDLARRSDRGDAPGRARPARARRRARGVAGRARAAARGRLHPAGEDRLAVPRDVVRRRAGRLPARVRARGARPGAFARHGPGPRPDLRAQHGRRARRQRPAHRRRPPRDAARPGARDARHAQPRAPAAGHVALAARGRARPARAAVLVPHPGARDRQGHRRPRHLPSVPGAVPAGDGAGGHRRRRRRRACIRSTSPSRR